MFDLKKPVGYDQFLRSFPSGGAGGGPVIATDGETVWAFNTDGGNPFVFRPDGKSFGSSPGAMRRNAYIPEGWVSDLTAARPSDAAGTLVYIAQRGKLVSVQKPGQRPQIAESATEWTNQITVHDADGKILSRIALENPQSLAATSNKLYAMHGTGADMTISVVDLKDGIPSGNWRKVFAVPANIKAFDMAVDSRGRFYLSDSAANKVYQLDAGGKTTRTFGRLAVQKPGTYDRETLMEPEKIATWRDTNGQDRLMIVEVAGPNRVSEWSAESGELMREFMTYQTKVNSGYAIDPADASHIYVTTHSDWLTRFKVDYASGEWKVDAVWPDVPAGQRAGLSKPIAIRANNNFYLASEQSMLIYRLDAARNRWVRSAAVLRKNQDHFFWNDANNNGREDEAELRATKLPGAVLTYHGQKWLSDLSYISPAMGGNDVWRLAPVSFDAHGNPIFASWQKLFTDPIFQARAEGKADAVHGGNELAETFVSDWMQADGSTAEGFYVQARGGENFTANYGAQHKISRYVPAADKSYRLKWRAGRSALQRAPERGEIQSAMRIFKPINGLLSVIDQSRAGIVLYTEDGLYVDTVFPDESKRDVGIYRQPGEFFAGIVYPNAQNGKIYYAAGKFTPFLYEIQGWNLKENPVRPITTLQKTVSLSAAQIASPPEIALTLRGGVGKARVARFAPALGGAELDGSLVGWESATPVAFSSKEKTVEARTLYTPDQLLLRWHVRLNAAFEPKATPPLERIWTHDQQSDTVGFYIQGDAGAAPNGPVAGRPGDARFVFGIFKDGGKIAPVGIGMYPQYASNDAKPQLYRTPVGEAKFAHVGTVPGLKMGHSIDADGKGFVIAASIPRSALPAIQTAFGPDFRTLVNFDANLGGHDKFWWANTDGSANRETYDEPSEARFYPGSWAPAQFGGLGDGVAVPNWLVAGPFGGAGAEKFRNDPANKPEVNAFYEAAKYPLDNGVVDTKAVFEGAQIRGYWPDPKQVMWKPASLAALDTRVTLGPSSQVWYGSTWIYALGETALTFDLQSHKMTSVRWSLNGQKIEVADKDFKDAGDNKVHRLVASRPATLRPGWNQVFFRAHNTGYVGATGFRVGLVLKAAPEKLWPLRFSNQPPAK